MRRNLGKSRKKCKTGKRKTGKRRTGKRKTGKRRTGKRMRGGGYVTCWETLERENSQMSDNDIHDKCAREVKWRPGVAKPRNATEGRAYVNQKNEEKRDAEKKKLAAENKKWEEICEFQRNAMVNDKSPSEQASFAKLVKETTGMKGRDALLFAINYCTDNFDKVNTT